MTEEQVYRSQYARAAQEDIFREESLVFLPFKEEPIAQWTADGDLQEYLYALCDVSSVCIDQSGVERSVNYRSYGKHLFDDGVGQYKNIANRFHRVASEVEPAPAAKGLTEEIPDFSIDEWFGLMAKYAIAWDSTANVVASESGFFSAAHLFECCTDLESSVGLAADLYYRQALQVLRSYIEDAVLDLYFCTRPQHFVAWQEGNFRSPPLRGKQGMLKTLIREGVLSNEVASALEVSYGYLNACVHGGEKQMVNRGLFGGQWTGRLFKYERFKNWCKTFSDCVDLGLRVLHTSVQRAPVSLEALGLTCDICHSVNDFEVIGKQTVGRPTTKLRCRRCKNTVNIESNIAEQHGF